MVNGSVANFHNLLLLPKMAWVAGSRTKERELAYPVLAESVLPYSCFGEQMAERVPFYPISKDKILDIC